MWSNLSDTSFWCQSFWIHAKIIINSLIMRQNDIFKNFNLPRWATPIICGFLGSAGGLCEEIFAGDPAQQWPYDNNTTADSGRDPIPQIHGGSTSKKPSRPYRRCSRTDILSGCWDTRRYWDRCDHSGGPFASVRIYVMMSIRNLCLYRTYNLYVKPHIFSFTKTVYFWYMP